MYRLLLNWLHVFRRERSGKVSIDNVPGGYLFNCYICCFGANGRIYNLSGWVLSKLRTHAV